MNSLFGDWKSTSIRGRLADYRRAQQNYYVEGKPLVVLENGQRVFSLLTPPLGSPVARRRVRRIMEDSARTSSAASGAAFAADGRRTPHVITVAVTYDCQCDCLHCSAADFQDRVSRTDSALDFEELRDAIEQAVDLGTTCVVLTGGEPLIYPRVYDLVRAVDKARSICTLFTNGEYLGERAVDRLKEAGAFGVFVSLDHASAEAHDANRRRPGLFARAVRGFELCRRAHVPCGISTYATREKIRDGGLDSMMELAKSLQALEVFLFDVIPTGRLSAHRDCVLSDREVGLVREFREKYNARTDYPGVIHQTMFSSIAYPCVAEGCPAGMVTLHLRANGEVSPCDFTPRSFGNVRQQSLADIWRTMTQSELYSRPSTRCRLSQPAFWTRLEESQPAV